MKGLDTNVLVRYFVQDDRAQSAIASTAIREMAGRGEPAHIAHIVLCELVWVLESAYHFSKGEIADLLEKVLAVRQFEIQSKDVVRQAVHDYRAGKGDLADYLIGRVNQTLGCDHTVTFDRALRGDSLFSVLGR